MLPTAAVFLALWEQWDAHTPAERAIALLSCATQEPYDAIGSLSLGQRDLRLLTLRGQLFGTHVTGLSRCATCGEQAEIDFDLSDLRAPAGTTPERIELRCADWTIALRLPCAADLAAAAMTGDLDHARQRLLDAVVLAAQCNSEVVTTSLLPAAIIEQIGEQLRQSDPAADLRIALTCPACSAEWEVIFDIAIFLWNDLDAWARRTLREVHTLARAYGWSETESLALNPRRRRHYLELVGA